MSLAARSVAFWRQLIRTTDLLHHLGTAYSTVTPRQESLEEIRSRIFGSHIGNGLRSGRKVLRKKLVGDKIADYYLEPISKLDPMFVDLDLERCALPASVHVKRPEGQGSMSSPWDDRPSRGCAGRR